MRKIFLMLGSLCLGVAMGGLDSLSVAQDSLPERPVLLDAVLPPIQGVKINADDVGKMAVLQGLDIRIARLNYRKEEVRNLETRSRYDTEVHLKAGYEEDESENSNSLIGDRTIKGYGDGRLTKTTPLGLKGEIYYNNARNSTRAQTTSINPNYESQMGFEGRFSLLKNILGTVDRNEVKIVKFEVDRMAEETRDRMEQLALEGRLAYWNYARDMMLIPLAEQNYQTASNFLEITQAQVQTGVKERVDLFAVEANLRQRLQDLILAQHQARNSLHQLQLTLHVEEGMLPSEAKMEVEPLQGTLDHLLDSALEFRRDYRGKKIDLEAKGLQLYVNKVKRLPELDAFGTLGFNGLDGRQAKTQREVWSTEHPNYILGFEFRFPLENKEARAGVRKAKIDIEKTELELKKLAQKIQLEIEDAYREVVVQDEILKQANLIEKLHRDKLAEEEKQFRAGRSSSKTLTDYQNDLVQAQIRQANALIDSQKARDKILRTQNKLLANLGFEDPLKEPESGANAS